MDGDLTMCKEGECKTCHKVEDLEYGICDDCRQKMYAKHGDRGAATALFDAPELGYRCPEGHANITWSEFKEHIWCYQCEVDYFYANCLLIESVCNPKDLPIQPRIIRGIPEWDETGNYMLPIPKEHLPKDPSKYVPPETNTKKS